MHDYPVSRPVQVSVLVPTKIIQISLGTECLHGYSCYTTNQPPIHTSIKVICLPDIVYETLKVNLKHHLAAVHRQKLLVSLDRLDRSCSKRTSTSGAPFNRSNRPNNGVKSDGPKAPGGK